jgi:DNA-binding ferritin-like protein
LAYGEHFKDIHESARNQAYRLEDWSDAVAEICVRGGVGVLTYEEVLILLKETETDEPFIQIESRASIDLSSYVTYALIMFRHILRVLEAYLETEELQSTANTGIRTTIENYHERISNDHLYTLQRYGVTDDSSNYEYVDEEEPTEDISDDPEVDAIVDDAEEESSDGITETCRSLFYNIAL